MWILFTAVLSFLSLTTLVLAQSPHDLFLKAQGSAEEYRNSHREYQLARNQHLQYQTGATRTQAIGQLQSLLLARNLWQIDYLQYLRSYLAQASNIANYGQTLVYLDLEKEISDLGAYAQQVPQAADFETLNDLSDNWQDRLSSSDRLIETTRLQIASARLATLHNQLGIYLEEFQALHASLSAAQSPTLDLARQKYQTSASLRESADNVLSQYRTSSRAGQSVLTSLSQSQQLLIESAKLLDEISR